MTKMIRKERNFEPITKHWKLSFRGCKLAWVKIAIQGYQRMRAARVKQMKQAKTG
jgi:hypothetical protein